MGNSKHSESEFREEDSEKRIEELLKIEEKIDELHERKQEGELSNSANPEGVGWREVMDLPEDWLDFIIHMGEVATVSKMPEKEIEELVTKFAKGKLNDQGEEENMRRLNELKVIFDEQIKPSLKRNA